MKMAETTRAAPQQRGEVVDVFYQHPAHQHLHISPNEKPAQQQSQYQLPNTAGQQQKGYFACCFCLWQLLQALKAKLFARLHHMQGVSSWKGRIPGQASALETP